MPIRMVKDPDQPEKGGRSPKSGGSGIAGIIIGLLLRNPKILIPVLLIGGAAYFFLGREGFMQASQQLLSMGCEMNEQVYDKAEVFEPLAVSSENYNLPDRVSLEKFCPDRLNQGQQGSCVGWSSAYAARTILQAVATGKDPNSVAFSPSSLYNQISLPGCQGAYIQNAMQVMQQKGVLPYNKFAYNENDCDRKPDASLQDLMSQYKTKGFNRLTVGGENYNTNLDAIKQNLAQGAPVVIGMMVGGSFMQDMAGKKLWRPDRSDYEMQGFGGHAMCIIGYDDALEGGSFQLMNSWGNEWGQNGIAWVRNKDFLHFNKEAYGLYPMGSNAGAAKDLKLNVHLVYAETGKKIPLKSLNKQVYETREALPQNSKFKISVSNSRECYIYVLGQETDQSSYVLFPYTEKHSAYCGITGTRLFPKDYSMSPDSIGTKDRMAVIVSGQSLDYKKLNQLVNKQKDRQFTSKLANVLMPSITAKTTYQTAVPIECTADFSEKDLIYFIVEINKK